MPSTTFKVTAKLNADAIAILNLRMQWSIGEMDRATKKGVGKLKELAVVNYDSRAPNNVINYSAIINMLKHLGYSNGLFSLYCVLRDNTGKIIKNPKTNIDLADFIYLDLIGTKTPSP